MSVYGDAAGPLGLWMRGYDDGTYRYMLLSTDGVRWLLLWKVARTYCVGSPAEFGLAAAVDGGTGLNVSGGSGNQAPTPIPRLLQVVKSFTVSSGTLALPTT